MKKPDGAPALLESHKCLGILLFPGEVGLVRSQSPQETWEVLACWGAGGGDEIPALDPATLTWSLGSGTTILGEGKGRPCLASGHTGNAICPHLPRGLRPFPTQQVLQLLEPHISLICTCKQAPAASAPYALKYAVYLEALHTADCFQTGERPPTEPLPFLK